MQTKLRVPRFPFALTILLLYSYHRHHPIFSACADDLHVFGAFGMHPRFAAAGPYMFSGVVTDGTFV